MQRRPFPLRTRFGAVCLLLVLASPLCAQGLDLRMQKVLAQFVGTTGLSVLGVGSWISGKTFNPKSSDFDMRLVLGGEGTPQQRLARWQQAQGQMRDLIRKEFGRDAANILARTNLYPPNQLMQGVQNAGDAFERFQQLNRVPNLAHTGPVTPATPAKYAEGLYGAGSQTYVQGYERAAGRLFYNNNGKCVTGLSELVHLGEGAPLCTAAGSANTAGQGAVHGLEELKAGRGDKVLKYLNRLQTDLIKSRSLSGLPVDEAFRARLKAIGDKLTKAQGNLSGLADEVGTVLRHARSEAALLKGFADAGPLRRAYMRVMLDGLSLKNQVGQALEKVMQKVPNWVDAESTMNFVVY